MDFRLASRLGRGEGGGVGGVYLGLAGMLILPFGFLLPFTSIPFLVGTEGSWMAVISAMSLIMLGAVFAPLDVLSGPNFLLGILASCTGWYSNGMMIGRCGGSGEDGL